MCGAGEQLVVMRVDWGWRVMAQTYPFLLTTSSFASCRQMLLQVPSHRVNVLAFYRVIKAMLTMIAIAGRVMWLSLMESAGCKSSVGLKRL